MFLLFIFVGGLFGSYVMDVTESMFAKRGIYSSVNGAIVGRWVIGLLKGKYYYSDIRNSFSYDYEIKVGIWFHYLIGGGCIALIYPVFFMITGLSLPENNILTGMAFGLMTSFLPWLILMPSIGWGMFGRYAPAGSRPMLASVLSHIPYGLSIGLMANLYNYIERILG